MKPRYLSWLLLVAFLVWLMPWQAKMVFPKEFAQSPIHWVSALINALLISVGLFLSFLALCRESEGRRSAGVDVSRFRRVVFVYPFHLRFGRPDFRPPVPHDGHAFEERLPAAQAAHSANGGEGGGRRAMAKIIYEDTGLMLPYRATEGSYQIAPPTTKDEEAWKTTQDTEANTVRIKVEIDWQLKQMTGLTSFYIGSFFLTFLLGIMTLVYRQGGRPGANPATD